MMYIKDKKISNGKFLVANDGKQIINPSHEQMLANGWSVYEPPQPSERDLKLAEIEKLKAQLASTDYKVVKLSECLAIGSEMPYNAQELHQQRQAIRDRINQLEMEVQSGENEQ